MIAAIRAGSQTDAWRTAPRARPSLFRQIIAMRLVWGAIVLLIGGAGAVYDKVAPQRGDPAVTSWPVEVEPIVAFVEGERNLAFDHPVAIEFLSESEYVDLFTPEATEPDDAVREEFDRLSELYNAAGLASDFDLLAGQNTVGSVSTIGLYIPSIDQILVRGTEMTPAVRAVIAHELTHALQAQHFDIALGGPDDLAVRSIVEADALRVEDAYIATLTGEEQQAAYDDLSIDQDVTDGLAAVPAALVEQSNAPYVLGPLLVEQAYSANGNDGVDELLRNPPTEEILVNPWLFGTDQVDAEPLVVAPSGSEVIEPVEQLSMIDMLAMLDAWLPWTQARGALDGWNGGGYVSYVRADGVTCFSVNASFDVSPEPFAEAVRAWSAAAGSTAAPTVDGQRAGFEACDRGPSAPVPPPADVALTAALYLESTAVDATDLGTADRWLCVARGMIDDPQVGLLLTQPSLAPDEEELVEWSRNSLISACGLVTDG